MSKKYYKIRVDDLFNINYYGIKADNATPAHPQNFKSLEYLYKIRYPKLMEKADNLAYMNYAVKEQNEISKGEMDKYNVPYYLVYTNNPGEIVYEDEYQIVAKVDDILIEGVPDSWSK